MKATNEIRYIHGILFLCCITIVIGKCKKTPARPYAGVTFNHTYMDGDVLTCEYNMGLTMCIGTCAKTGGCSFVNFEAETLTCELMGEIFNETSLAFQDVNRTVFVDMNNSMPGICGADVCKSDYTCVELSGGRNTCAPIDRQCCRDRYLVTGPHGVESDRVNYSSVYSTGLHSHYYLGSTYGWAPAQSDTDQWIQVVFLTEKVVRGVVTQGRPGFNDYVSSYNIRYQISYNRWHYVNDRLERFCYFLEMKGGSTQE